MVGGRVMAPEDEESTAAEFSATVSVIHQTSTFGSLSYQRGRIGLRPVQQKLIYMIYRSLPSTDQERARGGSRCTLFSR
jgi:hypothetical protein